jgi:hypothetical protein
VYSESRARVEWIGNDADRVRIVHGGRDELSSPQALERSLADQVISWHEQFGHRIVYLGGAYHTAVAAERAMAAIAAEPAASAGSLLRGAPGRRNLSGRVDVQVGLGTIPQPAPPPAPRTLEAELDALGYRTVLVPLGQLPSHVYKPLYVPKGLVISDHSYNARSGSTEDAASAVRCPASECQKRVLRFAGRRRLSAQNG